MIEIREVINKGISVAFDVFSDASCDCLGSIMWYHQYKKYCFIPCKEVIIFQGDLGEINSFIGGLIAPVKC